MIGKHAHGSTMRRGIVQLPASKQLQDGSLLRRDPLVLCCCVLQGLMERFQKKSGGFFGMDLSGIFGNK